MPAFQDLSADELVSKSIAPIKKEFILPYSSRPTTEAAPAAPAAAKPAKAATVADRKKSQKQKKQERHELRSYDLCSNFACGRCTYGDKCKFNHDVALFLAHKPADLPGSCPYSCLAECPFGITCRWYGSHKQPSPLAPPPAAVEQQQQASDAGAGGTASEPAAAAPSSGSDAAYLQQLSLPSATSIQPAVNSLSKELQAQLWKNRYDFSRADNILANMGLKVSKHGSKQQPAKGSDKPNQQQPAEPPAPAAAQAAAAAAEELLYSAYATSAEGHSAFSEEPAEPAAKRAKTDPCSLTDANPDDVRDAALRAAEVSQLDLRGKTYLAPLTTVGNLPFRRLCRGYGADVTCGEMAMCTNLLQGQASEWALLKRHPSEDCFGVQICGGFPDTVARAVQLIDEHIDCSFVDINMGCPIDLVCDKGGGSALLQRPKRLEDLVRSSSAVLASKPLTIKIRRGYNDGADVAHMLVPHVRRWGAQAVTLHGRTRQQRYSRLADWDYIAQCAAAAPGLQLVGNGDVFSYTQWNAHMEGGKLATCMIARGALIKPWIFTEIKEQRHWDISASERLDMLKQYAAYGLEHWGSDSKGVENTRRFLLEWMSFTHRYIPVGLLEVVPQQMQWRPPAFRGRNELETLLGSPHASDWIKVTSMLLGPPPAGFSFAPKHKSNSYAVSEAEMAGGEALALDVEEQAQG